MVLGCKLGIYDSQDKEVPITPTHYWKASDIAQSDNTTVSTWTDRVGSKIATGAFDSGGNLPLYYTSLDPYPIVRLTAARKNRFVIGRTNYNYTGVGFSVFAVIKFTNNYSFQRILEMYAFNSNNEKFIFGEYYRGGNDSYSGQFGSLAFFPSVTIVAGSGTAWLNRWFIAAILYNGGNSLQVYNHQTNQWFTLTGTKPTEYDLEITMSDTGTVCDMNIREFRIYQRALTQAQGQSIVNEILALYP